MTEPSASTEPLSPGMPDEQTDYAPPAMPRRKVIPRVVIEARRGWLGIDFQELWHYRELLYFLIWRDMKARYKQTVIGAAWAVIRPVTMMVVFSAIFGRLAEMPSDKIPYPLFVYAGLLPWTLFSEAVSQAGISLVSQANLITKIYFPRLFIPTANAGIAVVDFLVAFIVYFFVMGYYILQGAVSFPGWSLAILPLLIFLLGLAALGAGYVLASLTMSYRDFRSVIPFLMQTWMYISPVVYPASLMSQRNRWIMSINPMFGMINGFRSALLNRPIDGISVLISGVVSVLFFLFGLYYFRRTERRFADVA